MKNIAQNIRQYVSAWDEKTPEAIKAILFECCSPEVTYTDKQTSLLKGVDALTDLIMQSHQVVPGRIIGMLTDPETFDGHAYYSWRINIIGRGDLAGRDYMRYDQDNKITAIVGFLPVS